MHTQLCRGGRRAVGEADGSDADVRAAESAHSEEESEPQKSCKIAAKKL